MICSCFCWRCFHISVWLLFVCVLGTCVLFLMKFFLLPLKLQAADSLPLNVYFMWHLPECYAWIMLTNPKKHWNLPLWIFRLFVDCLVQIIPEAGIPCSLGRLNLPDKALSKCSLTSGLIALHFDKLLIKTDLLA